MSSLARRFTIGAVLTGMLLSQASTVAWSHSVHEHALSADRSFDEEARITFTDDRLTNQYGHSVNLKQDLVSGRIVVISFMYTQCTTVCPVVSAIMAKVQGQLGDRAGDAVSLISITIDPVRDTPERLREYAAMHRAGPGWSWLTGSVPAITATLKSLRSWSPDIESHQPVFLVGNDATGEWSRFYGFTDPEVIVARVDRLQQAHAETASIGMHPVDFGREAP